MTNWTKQSKSLVSLKDTTSGDCWLPTVAEQSWSRSRQLHLEAPSQGPGYQKRSVQRHLKPEAAGGVRGRSRASAGL